VAAVQSAVEQIFPLVQPFRSERTAAQIEKMQSRLELKRLKQMGASRPNKIVKRDVESEEEEESEESEDDEEENDD